MKETIKTRIVKILTASAFALSTLVTPFNAVMHTTVSAASTMTAMEITENMGVGWNLGNSLDSYGGYAATITDYEKQWGNPVVTQELISAVKAKGFNTIRVPVTWFPHISTDGSYTIDTDWLARVKEVVDYAYNQDMYVILNIHHEEWINRSDFSTAGDAMETELRAVWKQIAAYFSGYGQRLIFEGMNEPREVGGSVNEWVGDATCYAVVNQLNEAFVETVRSVQSDYQSTRMLMIPCYAASCSSDIYSSLTIPKSTGSLDADSDGADDYVAASIHAYSPYNFAMNEDGEHSSFNDSYKAELSGIFSGIFSSFLEKDIPVVIGEFSASNYGYDDARIAWAEYYMETATSYGIPCVLWDNNVESGNGAEAHGYINRDTNTWYTSGEKVVNELISTRNSTEWATISYPMYAHDDFANGTAISFSINGEDGTVLIIPDITGFEEGTELAIKHTNEGLPSLALMSSSWGGWTTFSPYDHDPDNKIAYVSYEQIQDTWNSSNGTVYYLKIINSQDLAVTDIRVLGIEEHTVSYSASGAVISAVCSDCSKDMGSVTVNAPASLTYDGNAKTATVTNTVNGLANPSVTYCCDGGCINAGNHTASITVEGATASVDFEIAKAIPTVTAPTATALIYGQKLSESTLTAGWEWVTPNVTPSVSNTGYAAYMVVDDYENYDYTQLEGYAYTDDTHKLSTTVPVTVTTSDIEYTAPTPVANLEYNGSAQALVTAGTATSGEMQYSLEENDTYSETIPTGKNAGTYTVWYKVIGDENYNDTTPASVEVTIAPKAITVTADNASKTYGDNDPALTYTATGLAGNDTLTGTLTRETGEDVGEYAITQGTLTDENNPNYDITFVNGIFTINGVDISTATAVQNGTLTYDGTAQTPTFTVTLGNTTLTADDYDVTITAQTNAGSYTATITGKGNCSGNIADVAWSIAKATPTADMFTYTAPTNLDYDGQQKTATVTTDKVGMGTITVKYSETPINVGTYTVSIDVAEGANYNAVSDLVVGTFTINGVDPTYTAPTVVADLEYNGFAQELVTAGTATGGTMKYSLDGANYTTIIPTATNADTYNVYWMVEGDAPNFNDITCDEPVSVTIAKAAPVLTTTPSAVTGLGYTGQAQALITAGATADGEIQYSVDGTTYTSTVPTGTEVDTYTVYYKIIGDSNHNDKTFDPITVSIGKGAAPVLNSEPVASEITYGQKLSASTLESGWKWVDENTIPSVNENCQAYYVVDDVNYDYTGISSYDETLHAIVMSAFITINPATPTVVVNATPAADIAGSTITVTATVANPNNASLLDTPTAELSYSINGISQTFTGSFVIPEETPEGTVITITAATAANGNYADGYATTTVTVTECTHVGTTTLTWDETAHWYHCSVCNADIDKTAHSGGTADCVNKAVCGTCNQVYGTVDTSNHTNVATAWTTENGYHWHECACGADVDKAACTGGTATCTTAALCETCGTAHGTVDTNNHANNVTTVWSSDSEYHWHECACGADIDKTAHSGGTADCMNKAKCEACGTEHGTVDTSNHANNVSTAWTTENDYHWHECACGADVDKAACSGGTATCTTAALCEVCGNEHGEINSNNHANKATVWSKDSTGHWYACDCGTLDFASHTSSGAATETTPETCTVCGYVITPATGHITHTADTSKWLSDGTSHWYKCVGCEEKMDKTSHTSSGAATETTPETCTVCGYVITPATGVKPNPVPTPTPTTKPAITPSPVVPTNKEPQLKGENGKTGWDVIADELKMADDGDTVVVDMNGTTKLPKDITSEIKDRDVDLVLDMGNGITWTINGLDVTNPKNVDMRVAKGTKRIPVDVINNVTGESYTIQISLEHNGDFGFTAVLTIDLGKKNNGLIANLFWYNEKSDKLELTDFDEIANGKANLIFTHASEWAVVIDEEALGEFDDVSSASGIKDTSDKLPESTATPIAAVITSLAGLAFLTIVIARKRQSR